VRNAPRRVCPRPGRSTELGTRRSRWIYLSQSQRSGSDLRWSTRSRTDHLSHRMNRGSGDAIPEMM
jgi:hypothetical protein